MDDHDFSDFIVALKLVGDLLTKSKADDLKELFSGEATLGLVPRGWKIMPPGSRAPSTTKITKATKVEIPSAPRIRAMLLGVPHGESRVSLLRDLEMGTMQARRLAKELGVGSAGRSSVDQVIEKIVEHYRDATVSADEP